MSKSLVCRLKWSRPRTAQELLTSRIEGQGKNYVYAIIVRDHGKQAMLRLGATANLPERVRGYRTALELIHGSVISWCQVPAGFGKDLKRILKEDFRRGPKGLPKHLARMTLKDYLERELKSIEYKVERLILEEYKKRNDGSLPPGNARTGSYRRYLDDRAQVVEGGSLGLLDLPPARLRPVRVGHEQLVKLLR